MVRRTLEDSAALRLSAIFLLYVAQGMPLGLALFALPIWMAANGAPAAEIAALVGSAALPWSCKPLFGALMDRYSFLPMGRRRSWIIGAQSAILTVLVGFSAFAPSPDKTGLLALFAFLLGLSTAILDVATDGLAVDIFPSRERRRASGMMYGGQAIGKAIGTSMSAAALTAYGISAAAGGTAILVTAALFFVLIVRERAGERQLPWSPGAASLAVAERVPTNLHTVAMALLPSMLSPRSLVWIVFLLATAMIDGIWAITIPEIGIAMGSWSQGGLAGLISSAQLAAGIAGLIFGGFVGSAIGARRLLSALVFLAGTAQLGLLALWETGLIAPAVTIFIVGWIVLDVLVTVALTPVSMNLCDRRIPATQFACYMSLYNLGITLGAIMVGLLAGAESLGILLVSLVALSFLGMTCIANMDFDRPKPRSHSGASGTNSYADSLASTQLEAVLLRRHSC